MSLHNNDKKEHEIWEHGYLLGLSNSLIMSRAEVYKVLNEEKKRKLIAKLPKSMQKLLK